MPWVVIVSQSEKSLFSIIDTQTNTLVIISLLLIAVSILAATLISQFISKPIVALTAVAEKITAGDLSARAIIKTQDEVGLLANNFNRMTEQLYLTLIGLEQRVAERTKALNTSTEVSRRLSTILDQKQLVNEVVEQVQSAFNYYHAHIYFWTKTPRIWLWRAGQAKPAQPCWPAATSYPRVKVWWDAPPRPMPRCLYLTRNRPGLAAQPPAPETKSEVAVPISIGDKVLGVLDVQHNL